MNLSFQNTDEIVRKVATQSGRIDIIAIEQASRAARELSCETVWWCERGSKRKNESDGRGERKMKK